MKMYSLIAIAAVAMVACAAPVMADDAPQKMTPLQAQIVTLINQRNAAENQVAELAGKLTELQGEVDDLKKQIPAPKAAPADGKGNGGK